MYHIGSICLTLVMVVIGYGRRSRCGGDSYYHVANIWKGLRMTHPWRTMTMGLILLAIFYPLFWIMVVVVIVITPTRHDMAIQFKQRSMRKLSEENDDE